MLEKYNFLKRDKVIGILSYDDEDKKFNFEKISKDINDYPLPFFFHRGFNEKVPEDILYNYLEERVIDKHYTGLNEVLDLIGIEKWDLYKILKYNMGKTDRDQYWIDFNNPVDDK